MSNVNKGYYHGNTFYCSFSMASDTMMVELLLADRACVVAERVVRKIADDHKLYKGKLKRLCNKVYNAKGKYIVTGSHDYVGTARAVAKKMCRNMSADEIDKLADMASAYDILADEKLGKLINSVLIDVRSSSSRATLLSEALTSLYVCMISYHGYEHLTGGQGDARYALCECPLQQSSRDMSYRLDCIDMKRLVDAVSAICVNLFRIEGLEAIASDITKAGILSLIHLSMDYGILYDIAGKVGIDLRLTSPVQNHPETQAKMREQERENKEKKREFIILENNTTIYDVATAKGWKIKTA